MTLCVFSGFNQLILNIRWHLTLEDTLRIISLVLIFTFITSCSLKDALERGAGNIESDITPIAKVKRLGGSVVGTLGDDNKTVITMKIPISESSIDHYDLDSILEEDRKDKNFLNTVWREIKLRFYNLAVGLGISNQVRISTVLELLRLDPKYFKEVKVKKVFFTTEDCREGDTNCDSTHSEKSSFSLIEKFMINIDEFKPLRDGHLKNETTITRLMGKGHKSERVDNLNKIGSSVRVEDVERFSKSIESDGGINILSFHNQVPHMNFEEVNGVLYVNVPDSKERNRVKSYLSSSVFINYIESVYVKGGLSFYRNRNTAKRKQIVINLKKGVKSADFIQKINAEQSPGIKNMLIFRLSGKGIQAKHFFKQPRYASLVKDMTMINRSLFIETYSGKVDQFLKLVAKDNEKIKKNLDIYKIQRCNISNCLDLKARNTNLVPLLVDTPDVRIDTYIQIRSLGSIDFKYNGYLELEVTLDLPL